MSKELFQINIGNNVNMVDNTVNLEDIPDQFQFSDNEDDSD